MSPELLWLTLTVAMTGLFWIPYVLNRIVLSGVTAAMDNPPAEGFRAAPWAARQMCAHKNAVENLVVFAPLVLITQALGISTGVTATACVMYFWARLAHYIIYTLGIPVLRTLSFAAGFIAQAMLVLAIFRLV
jgi:uncharacterized MAPEG superfamily protein